MALFKKKSDPISARARVLNDQIAALEAQIKKLSEEPARPAEPDAPPASAKRQPRLRSTTRPHGPTVPANPFTTEATPAVIIEEANQDRLHAPEADFLAEPGPDLGVRKYDWAAVWQRLKNHFSGPSTSNPKLVSYLAAGSVQGLRPLRYEKRVARNRFLLFLAGLILILWGLLYVIFGHK